MPGPFTHIYNARRTAELLGGGLTPEFVRPHDDALGPAQQLAPDGAPLDPRACGEAMQQWPKFAALGAIGPDIFFFLQDYASPLIPCDEIMLAMSLLYWLDDQGRLPDPYAGLVAIIGEISDTWAAILRFIIKLDQVWQKFVQVWDATIGPILDKVGQVIDDALGGLLSTLGDAFTQLKNDLLALAATEVLTEWDIFSWFALKMRSGYDEKAFVWSDMLHYRRTSRVPQRLLHQARALAASDSALDRTHAQQLTAFALGWICHVGTDVVAHSFVNEQCGGPFRTHWQRHHLVENHVDAWLYQGSGDGTVQADDFVGSIDTYRSLNESALYFAVQIPQGIDDLPADQQQGDLRQPLPEGDDRESKARRKELLDTDGELPDWLATAIVKALIEVYADPAEGGLAELQEEPAPHPLNLLGQAFQDGLGDGTVLLGKWLEKIGVDNAGIALPDLRRAVAPDTPASIGTVPPGFPLPWEVKATYRFLLSWFKRSYVSGFDMDKPQRPTVFTPPSSDYDFGPPDFSGVSSSDDPVSEACAAILAILDWIFKTLEKVGQLLYDLAKMAASAATLPARDAIYDGVILPCWQVAENLRMVLTHLGYLMPQSEERWDDGEIRKPSEIDLELITLGHTVDGAFAQALQAAWDPLGHLDTDPSLITEGVRNPKSADYPWLPVRDLTAAKVSDRRDVVEFRRPWGYPDRINETDDRRAGNWVETPRTMSGPYPQNARPTVLVGTAGPASNELRALYEAAGCPHDTDLLNERYVTHAPGTNGYAVPGEPKPGGTNPLGDPVVFSAYLIGQVANNRSYGANFNLDADRAFGYLCWDWTRQKQAENQQPTNPRGQHYPAPVVWSEGADGSGGGGSWAVPAPVAAGTAPDYAPALQLRYPGRECNDGKGDEGVSGAIRWKTSEIRWTPDALHGPVAVEAVTRPPGQLGDTVVATGAAAGQPQLGESDGSLAYTITGVPLDVPVRVRVAGASSHAFVAVDQRNFVIGSSGEVTLTAQQPSATGVDVILQVEAIPQ